ncbi:MAG: hydroxymethylbilane synthase [Acidobacteria bacterium]|nr:hydroxymethylbilane synthase [Acidobacteriota bacterium]
MPNLIIGSRGSKLALWQANWVKSELERLHDGLTVEIEIIKTTGDKLTEASLARMPGKGVFTKEIEEALLDRRIDLAVHSLKDLPTTLPEGMHLAAITRREDPRDALIVNRRLASRVNSLLTLPVQPRIGTSSPRRAAQIRLLRPDAQIFELRGNVETRLHKLDEGDYDAIILAAAGLNRLGFSSRITQCIPITQLLPAVGQGALGIETCIEDERTNYLLEGLNHWPTRNAVEAERALLKGLGGGCAVPIAAFAQVDGSADNAPIQLEALVCNVSGTKIVRHTVTGTQFKCEELGRLLARHLIAAGARELLDESDDIEPVGEPEFEPPSGTMMSGMMSNQTRPPSIETKLSSSHSSPYDSVAYAEAFESESSTAVAVLEETPEPQAYAEPSFELPTEALPEPIVKNEIPSEPEPLPMISPAVSPLSEETFIEEIEEETETQTLPLTGKRILVTRARHQADGLANALKTQGAEVISCPTIEIRPPDSWKALDAAINNLRAYHWLVFTSSNGVSFFLRRFDETGHGRAELAALKICAVGKKTADKLKEERLQVDLTPDKFTAETLVSAFIRKFGVSQRIRGTRMLLPAAKATRDVIRPSLTKLGVDVDVVEAYQNVLPDLSNEEVLTIVHQAQADYVIFTSPSTVNNLAVLLDSDQLASQLPQTRVACIGPVTAKAAEQCGLTVHLLPEEHTVPAIVDLIIQDSQG